jgi:ABC-type cobalamin transport system ATPase subunit
LKAGQVYRDGPKGEILTTEALSDAFGVKPQILQRNGFYHAW